MAYSISSFLLAATLVAPPVSEPSPEPAPAPAPAPADPEPSPSPSPSPEPVAEPTPEPVPAAEPVPEPEPVPAAEPEPVAAPAPEQTAIASGPKGFRHGLRRHRFVYKNLTALRYNPLGLVNEFTLGWRVQLVDRNTTLFKDSYFALKGHSFVNPAFGRVGPMLEIQPLALLNLQVIYNAVGYFKSFDQLQSFASPAARYSDTELDARTAQRFGGTGHYITLSALLQAKAGRIAFRDNLKFYYADFKLKQDPVTRREDTAYYDQTLDILHPDEGWVTTNDLDFLYLFDIGVKLGARYTFTHAFYRDEMYLAGENTVNRNSPTHRVGPALLYSPRKWHAKAAKRTKLSRKRWYNPTAFLLVQWWAQHRWRTGEDVSPGVPYLVLGFSFEGDLFP